MKFRIIRTCEQGYLRFTIQSRKWLRWRDYHDVSNHRYCNYEDAFGQLQSIVMHLRGLSDKKVLYKVTV